MIDLQKRKFIFVGKSFISWKSEDFIFSEEGAKQKTYSPLKEKVFQVR
jgi:hypothetical protein